MAITTDQVCWYYVPMPQIPENWEICICGLISLETCESIMRVGYSEAGEGGGYKR